MKIIVFTTNNARILNNPENPDSYRAWENAVFDPELKDVKGLPPHYWFFSRSGQISPLRSERRSARDENIQLNGADNEIRELRYNDIFFPKLKEFVVDLLHPPVDCAKEAEAIISKELAIITSPPALIPSLPAPLLIKKSKPVWHIFAALLLAAACAYLIARR